jgi:hypothetical protein
MDGTGKIGSRFAWSGLRKKVFTTVRRDQLQCPNFDSIAENRRVADRRPPEPAAAGACAGLRSLHLASIPRPNEFSSRFYPHVVSAAGLS